MRRLVTITGSKQRIFVTDGRKQGPETSTPRIGGLVDDDTTTSESETESESDYESDAEQPPGGHVIILDASKNQATDTKETLRGRAVGDKGHYQVRFNNNNNNEYLECLTRTGPKHLHVLYKYIFVKIQCIQHECMHTRTHTHRLAHAHTHTNTHTHTPVTHQGYQGTD